MGHSTLNVWRSFVSD